MNPSPPNARRQFALSGSTLDYAKRSGRDLLRKALDFREWQRTRVELGFYGYGKALVEAPRTRTTLKLEEGTCTSGLNFSSQDYLGLASHPRIKAAAHAAVESLGVHSAGSCALAGNVVTGQELEAELASFVGHQRAMLFPTGWAAGFGIVKALVRDTDTVVLDSLAHNCLQEGASAATPRVHRFRHLDTDHAREILKRTRAQDSENGILLITETVFSMDSDSPKLGELRALCREFDALFLVDVAHDLGCMGPNGRGQLEIQNILGDVDILIGSFSKTFASNGGCDCLDLVDRDATVT